MNVIEQKKARIAELEELISNENRAVRGQRGVVRDVEKIQEWENEKAQLLSEIEAETAAETAVQIETAHYERVVQATDELTDIIDNLDVGEGLTPRNYFATESDYQIVTIAFKQAVSVKLAAFSEIIKGFEEREIQLQRQNSKLQAQNTSLQSIVDVGKPENERLTRENGDLRDYIAKLNDEKADIESKLQNAVAENERLNIENQSLSKQLEAKAKPVESVPELSAEEKARRVLEKKAEITVYRVIPDREMSPTKFTALLAANDKEIEYTWMAKNRYINLDERAKELEVDVKELVCQFRTEFESATAAQPNTGYAESIGQVEPVQTIEAPELHTAEPVGEQFPEAHSVEGTQASSPVAEMAGTEDKSVVSREEFEALKSRVERIERNANLPGVA